MVQLIQDNNTITAQRQTAPTKPTNTRTPTNCTQTKPYNVRTQLSAFKQTPTCFGQSGYTSSRHLCMRHCCRQNVLANLSHLYMRYCRCLPAGSRHPWARHCRPIKSICGKILQCSPNRAPYACVISGAHWPARATHARGIAGHPGKHHHHC